MKHLRLFSVIMVLALCFGVAQNIDAKKKKHRNTHKKEKFQSLKQVEECNRGVIEAVDEERGTDDVTLSIKQIEEKKQGAVGTCPTGDYAYDAKQVGEEVIKILMRDINSEDDINQMEKDTDALQKKYEDFYKARGEEELKKFNEALDKLDADPVFSKRFEEAKKSLMEKAFKLFE